MNKHTHTQYNNVYSLHHLELSMSEEHMREA